MATTVGNHVATTRLVTAVAAGELVFVDTNVLVYARTSSAPFHTEARSTLGHLRQVGAELWTGRQIFREYLATLSRPQPFTPAIPAAALVTDITTFSADFRIAEDGPAVTAQLLALLSAVPCGGKQVHDANIVATMLAHGIPNILTHNVADFTRFGGYVAVVPLVP